ncbi:MAG: hypothetical protein AB7O52_10500 [Planctomycetota bacterium]
MNDQIIEKRASSPLGTSLLAVSAFAMIAAVVLLGMHLRGLTVAGAEGPTTSARAAYKAEMTGGKLIKAEKLLKDHAGETQ